MKRLTKLYSGLSILNDFMGRDQVIVHWHKVNTNWEAINPNRLIKNFDSLRDGEKFRALVYANEFFKKDEIETVRRVLKKEYGYSLLMSEYSLPLKFKCGKTGQEEVPYTYISNPYNTIEIDTGENELPFELSGYFNLDGCPPSNELPDEMKRCGLIFLNEVFNRVIPDLSLWDDRKMSMLEEIYKEYGLYVSTNSDEV